MTAFTAVGRAGYALFHRAGKIEGGRTYAVVWRDDKAVQFPDEWENEPLEKRGEFSAALVFVPKFLSQASIEWIQANLQLTAEHKVPNIVQVWPPISNRITTQSIQSVRDNPILIALDEVDARQAPSMFVRCDSDERAAGGISGARTFFRYEPGGKPTARFLTPGTYGAMLDVEFSLPISTPWHALNAIVMLRATSNEGGTISAVLHSRHASQVLLDIRHAHAKLDYISMPPAAQGWVRVRQDDTVLEYTICASTRRVAGHKHGFHPNDEDAARLVDDVCKSDADVVIDFGALGFVSLPAATESKGSTAAVELPEQVRALLKKYLFQFGSTSVWPRPDMRMSDFELVHVFNRSRWIKGDSVTRRYLARELTRYVDGVAK
ncbi:hypothetical protein [Paraburkholderia sp. BL25I1N1]|uniref:hypothetical protein n=1 Tax=Paraburkholderia sp. BL25I1N1 TaxID=1938804 RepID=UPI0011B226FD|nr:hypothetical protein [Paraburkholderia sp. BL25I1N1]